MGFLATISFWIFSFSMACHMCVFCVCIRVSRLFFFSILLRYRKWPVIQARMAVNLCASHKCYYIWQEHRKQADRWKWWSQLFRTDRQRRDRETKILTNHHMWWAVNGDISTRKSLYRPHAPCMAAQKSTSTLILHAIFERPSGHNL